MTASRPIRVLFVSAAGERGGAEAVLLNLLCRLDRRRVEPFAICLHEGSFPKELERRAQVDVEVVPTRRLRNLRSTASVIRHLHQIVRARKVGVVHCNGTGAHLYGRAAAWLGRKPCIFHLHDLVEWSWTKQGFVNLLARVTPATATVAVSHHVARSYQRCFWSDHPVRVIHNAIDDGPSREEARQEASHPSEWTGTKHGALVVWCGRLQQWKGAHIFLKAAAMVRKQMPDTRFLIVGGPLFGLDPGYEAELHGLARTLDLQDSLRFTGHQSDVQRFLAAADLVVHCSIRPDPFGLVILEAMTLGKPVIASGEGGPLEIVQPGITGLLVPPGNVRGLAQAVIDLLNNPDQRRAMGEAGRQRAKTTFGISHMVQAIEDLYQELVGD